MQTVFVNSVEEATLRIGNAIDAVTAAPMQNTMRELAENFYDGVKKNFERQVNSDGVLWPARSDKTGLAGTAGHPLLRKTDELYDAATGQAAGGLDIEDRAFTAYVDKTIHHPGAMIHQFGGDVPNAFGLGVSVHIPQREYFYVNDDALTIMIDTFTNAITTLLSSELGNTH